MNNFKARQTECVHGKGMPGKYVMVEMWDQYAGLGNQFPSMITGMDYRYGICLQNMECASCGGRQHDVLPLHQTITDRALFNAAVIPTFELSASMPA